VTLRLGALQDALLDPGNIEKATKAAEELAGYENRLASIDTRLAVLSALVGVNIALTSGVLWVGFTIMGRLPR
jgi:hypothetical protein